MNEGLPINKPKNQSQETSIETEIADPGEEVAETANEIGNLQEALPEQEKSTPPDPNLINELYDQFKLEECDDYHFLRIADHYFKEGTLTLKAIYLDKNEVESTVKVPFPILKIDILIEFARYIQEKVIESRRGGYYNQWAKSMLKSHNRAVRQL